MQKIFDNLELPELLKVRQVSHRFASVQLLSCQAKVRLHITQPNKDPVESKLSQATIRMALGQSTSQQMQLKPKQILHWTLNLNETKIPNTTQIWALFRQIFPNIRQLIIVDWILRNKMKKQFYKNNLFALITFCPQLRIVKHVAYLSSTGNFLNMSAFFEEQLPNLQHLSIFSKTKFN